MSRDSNQAQEFYVGYLPQAPPRMARWLRPRVVGLVVFTCLLAVGLSSTQSPFARSNFEYGIETTLRGTIHEGAIPTLEVERPGGGASSYLLTTFGKHGATEAVRGLDGSQVEVKGTLVYRDSVTMIELTDDGLLELGPETYAIGGLQRDGPITLRGEIVDAKCFLGVMKPGNLKPHRACAVRCISGGVPPVLLVRDAEGHASYFLLVGPNGEAVNSRVLPFVAEPVEITGELSGYTVGPPIVRIDPANIRRLP